MCLFLVIVSTFLHNSLYTDTKYSRFSNNVLTEFCLINILWLIKWEQIQENIDIIQKWSRNKTTTATTYHRVTRVTRRVTLVEQELLTLPEHMSPSPVFSGVRVTQSLVLCVCFVDRCLFFYAFPFGNGCSSSIYRFWLPLGKYVLLCSGYSFSISTDYEAKVQGECYSLNTWPTVVYNQLNYILTNWNREGTLICHMETCWIGMWDNPYKHSPMFSPLCKGIVNYSRIYTISSITYWQTELEKAPSSATWRMSDKW